jgi:hypothetical protein
MPRVKCVSACEALRATNYLQSKPPMAARVVFSTTARPQPGRVGFPTSSIIPGLVSKVDPTPSISMTLVLVGETGRCSGMDPWLRTALRAASSATPQGANEIGSTSPARAV